MLSMRVKYGEEGPIEKMNMDYQSFADWVTVFQFISIKCQSFVLIF